MAPTHNPRMLGVFPHPTAFCRQLGRNRLPDRSAAGRNGLAIGPLGMPLGVASNWLGNHMGAKTMVAWKNLLLAGMVGCSLAFACEVGTSDDDIEDTSPHNERGGSGNSGIGGSTSGDAGSGDIGAAGEYRDFIESDCPDLAAGEAEDTCTRCMYESLCPLAVPCLNTDECYESVIGAANCVADAWLAADADTPDDPDDGFVTTTQEEECFVENAVLENEGNDLWIALSGRDEVEANNVCATYCYMGPDDVIDGHH